ncbi:g1620 [Coccomyxa viridis]|uniref:2-C-methyl-D-erythritol 2,4-cyclodiphosphate synthase n=1 Tax=Coccomyxa viridis TaxID=1274662 RepID=A0ABP1FM68_9CHLO
MPVTRLQHRFAPQLARSHSHSRTAFSSKPVSTPCRRRGAGPRCAMASPADIKLEAMEDADRRRAPALPYRIGHGFDLHRLEEGPYKLILGGLEIPHDRGCVAHSDGDALLHTVTDAILGALSQPDIGQLFPDSDPKWKGQTSDVFVKEAVRLMHDHGYELGNLDATIILQRPKLSPHKERIRENLCQLLDAHPSTINIKAKTHEKVDSLGENRSIAVHAVCMLIRKDLVQ